MISLRSFLAAAALISVVGVGSLAQAADGYTASTEKNFTDGCMNICEKKLEGQADAKATCTKYCGCSYTEIQNRMSYAEFLKLGEAASKNEDGPPELAKKLQEATGTCNQRLFGSH